MTTKVRKDGASVLQIVSALERLGPMTYKVLLLETGLPKGSVSSSLSRMHKRNKTGPQKGSYCVHITRWDFEAEGDARRYPRPVYRLGHGIDKKKPKPKSTAESSREWRRRLRSKSVFTVGPQPIGFARTRIENYMT